MGFEPTIPATNRSRSTPQTARPLSSAITGFLIFVNYSLCGVHFCHTSHRHKTNGQIISQILSSSEYDFAKPIKFNDAIDEFASVSKKSFTANFQFYMKNVTEFYFMLYLYTVNKLKF
jgi:hypothetical protein